MWASFYHGPRSVTGNIEVVYFTRQGSDAVISVSLIVCVNGYEGKAFIIIQVYRVNKIDYVLEHYFNNLLQNGTDSQLNPYCLQYSFRFNNTIIIRS